MLLIIDNQSTLIKKFKRQYLSEQDFDYVFFDHNQPITLSAKTNIKGIILSGGKGTPFEPLNLASNYVAMMNFDVPILGICLGHEIIAIAYRGRIKRLAERHARKEMVTITRPEDPIFDGVKNKVVSLTKRHSFHISELPVAFESLAESSTTPYEVIKHKEKPIYGFQAHPEASGEEGIKMIENFLKICGIINE